MTQLEIQNLEEPRSGYRIRLHFAENEKFEDEVLEKEVNLHYDEGQPVVCSVSGCSPKWIGPVGSVSTFPSFAIKNSVSSKATLKYKVSNEVSIALTWCLLERMCLPVEKRLCCRWGKIICSMKRTIKLTWPWSHAKEGHSYKSGLISPLLRWLSLQSLQMGGMSGYSLCCVFDLIPWPLLKSE